LTEFEKRIAVFHQSEDRRDWRTGRTRRDGTTPPHQGDEASIAQRAESVKPRLLWSNRI